MVHVVIQTLPVSSPQQKIAFCLESCCIVHFPGVFGSNDWWQIMQCRVFGGSGYLFFGNSMESACIVSSCPCVSWLNSFRSNVGHSFVRRCCSVTEFIMYVERQIRDDDKSADTTVIVIWEHAWEFCPSLLCLIWLVLWFSGRLQFPFLAVEHDWTFISSDLILVAADLQTCDCRLYFGLLCCVILPWKSIASNRTRTSPELYCNGNTKQQQHRTQ